MCIGIPMQVIDPISDTFATCEDNGISKKINIQLIGRQITGTWVLVFIDSAREVISVDRAKKINAALMGLTLAANDGKEDEIQQLFGDLINREPFNPFFK